jgi:hypothetical protein
MLVVRFQGGLGNQLFQLAAARDLALAHGLKVRADLGWFDHGADTEVTRRRYLLPELGLAPPPVAHAAVQRFLRPLPRSLRWLPRGRGALIVRSADNTPIPPLPRSNSIYLDAYCQGESFFRRAAPGLAADLLAIPPHAGDADLVAELERTGSVAVHVRRGDYIAAAAAGREHRVLPLDHYAAALAVLRPTFNPKQLVVFSDDIAWCRENLPRLGFPVVFVTRTSPEAAAVRDLLCLARARACIVANSTFSWWGAWIATHRGAQVVAPAKWFATPSHEGWNTELRVPAWLVV